MGYTDGILLGHVLGSFLTRILHNNSDHGCAKSVLCFLDHEIVFLLSFTNAKKPLQRLEIEKRTPIEPGYFLFGRRKRSGDGKVKIITEVTLFYLQTNIPFLINLLKEEEFLGGAVTTDFILKRPELFKVQRGQNRAQKLLQYLGNVMVNGPCTPLATGLKPSKDAPEAPEV